MIGINNSNYNNIVVFVVTFLKMLVTLANSDEASLETFENSKYIDYKFVN